MEEVASAEPFVHHIRHWNTSECFVPSMASENGDEDESGAVEGNLETEDLDDEEVAWVKSGLIAPLSVFDDASEKDANSVVTDDHYEPLKVEIDESSSKHESLKKAKNGVSNLKSGTVSSPVRRSTSARSTTQAPPSPKPYLRSSSLAASSRHGSATESNIRTGNGSAKLGPPIISAAPIIKRRSSISGEGRSEVMTRRSISGEGRSDVMTRRSISGEGRSEVMTRRSVSGVGRSELITRRSAIGPGTIGNPKPSRTTDSTVRKSLSGMMNPVSRRHSLSGITSVSRSLDLSPSSDVSSFPASTPPLKASGRRVQSNSASSSVLNSTAQRATAPARQSSSTPALENLSRRNSLSGQKKSAADSVRPSPEKSTSARSQTSSSPSSSVSLQRSSSTTAGFDKEAPKKKLSSSASIGLRRTSSFAEPVGFSLRGSTSSNSKPSERSPPVSTQSKRSSPSELVSSSSATSNRTPDKVLIRGGTSNGKSPTSTQNSKSSTSRAMPKNTDNGGSKDKASRPSQGSGNGGSKEKPSRALQGSDRGPTRGKSLTSDTEDSHLIPLPSVDVKAGGDDIRFDLRGRKVRTLDGNLVTLTSKMEFVYLRDNKLSTLSGIEILRRVKVLDLSFNEFKGSGFEPLAHCKALQQLYLAGNQITNLTDLPLLPNLEFLSVAQNKIRSLHMAPQPRLQVLAASKNKISTLKDFPNLPALEHLRLEENPILEKSFHVEAQSILLVGPSLKKFNDRDLSLEELKLARMYPPSTALCIREGWELCDPEKAAESTRQFLNAQWSETIPPGYMVKKTWVDRPQEDFPCACEFAFERVEDILEETELVLKYQWFLGDKTPISFVPIDGADTPSYWPKHEDVEKCLKVECSMLLGEKQYGPVFAISAPVAAGSKCPVVLGLKVEGEFTEGAIVTGFPVVAWCGGTSGKSVSSWLRRKEQSSPVAIMGAEEREYRLHLDDVGHNLIFMYTPVTAEGVKGEPQYASTPVVQASPPSVSSVRIIGEAVNGIIIQGAGQYFGGQEGASQFEWLRENLDSGEFKLVSRGHSDYTLTDEDVGRRIMFMYTPVNVQGRVGDPLTATSATVLLGPPTIEELRIVGDLKEGNKVAVSALFTGGTEGASRVQWFKKATPFIPTDDSEVEPLSSPRVAKAFRIPIAAVGHYLVAKYIPVRSDNEVGKPVYAISETVVEMLPPGLTFLNLVGEFVEGETLTAQYGYVGGCEGASLYSWFLHEIEDDPGTLVVEAERQLQYRISKQAVNKLISFRCRPVRDDGVAGEWQITFGTERIRAGSPKLLSLHILGEPMEGHQLQVGKEYWGGDEGICKVQWFVTRQDGTQREIKGAVHDAYAIQSEDIDGLLCVSCEPVRSDGVTGQIVVSSSVGPVVPALPGCTALELCGESVEGGSLSFKAAYKGGEKGACFQEWVRHNVDGSQITLSTSSILDLTTEDVGSEIELVYTPVRKDGLRGDSKSVISDIIVDGEPEGTDLVIPQCFQDVEVIPRRVYFGGEEGKSEYTWYRTAHRPKNGQLPEDAKRLPSETDCYIPFLDDVGSYLVLHWVPVRRDGKRGTPIIGYSNLPVAPALPVVSKVSIKGRSPGMYVGEGEYYGGLEGESQFCWYRQTTGGLRTVIDGAVSKTYIISDDDYTCSVVFGYTPVRSDGVVGELVLSDPSPLLYPEMPCIHKLVLKGQPVEGETLTALEVIPRGDAQQYLWEKYKKDVKYQWSRAWQPATQDADHYETLTAQRTCSFKVRLEDQGYTLRCEAIMSDVFGRSSEPVYVITSPVLPGFPKVENLDIEGRGYHTSLYAVRGIYSGGKEGKSTLQWFRAMAGSPDLIPISGEVGRMYEANVDDVGYRLVAVYTPVRDDGTEGGPVSVSTDPIIVNPEVAKEVKLKLELGAVKFEALKDRDRSPVKLSPKFPQQQSLERRVLDVNRKRVKVVKPGSKTSFASTEIRGTYAPPFHVEVFRNDQHRLKIVVDTDNEVDLMVQSRDIRDIIVLVIRGFSQRFNTTPLNLLLKM